MAKKTTEKIKCTCCSKEKYATRDFYKSASELNADTERLNVCKECVQNRYEILLTVYNGNSMNAFRHLLMNLDEYLDEELYNSCIIKDDINFIGDYFRQVNGTKERRDKTSLNNASMLNDSSDIKLEDGIISEELVDKYGEGYTASEYRKLERKYNIYSEHYPNKRLQEQEILKQLAELDLMKEKCRITGDRNGYDKISTQIRRTMEDLNVLPKQSTDDEDKMTLGNILKLIEYEEPIPMTSNEFDDVNRIEEIMNKYFVAPFKRVLGLNNKNVGDIDE